MTEPLDPDQIDDDERTLLGEIAESLPSDRMPDGLVDRAAELITWFGVDDEIATLLDRPADELAGTRSAGTSTAMGSFATDDGEIELNVDVEPSGADRTLSGFVARGEVTIVVLLNSEGDDVARAGTDEFGRFEIEVSDSVHGAHRLRIVASERTVVTDWFVL